MNRATTPHPRPPPEYRGTGTTSLLPVGTLVVWMVCLVVGVTGLKLRYPRPAPTAKEPEPVLAGPLEVVVQFHEPLSLDSMDRKTLARRARRVIQAGLAEALQGRTPLDLLPASA